MSYVLDAEVGELSELLRQCSHFQSSKHPGKFPDLTEHLKFFKVIKFCNMSIGTIVWKTWLIKKKVKVRLVRRWGITNGLVKNVFVNLKSIMWLKFWLIFVKLLIGNKYYMRIWRKERKGWEFTWSYVIEVK